MLRPAYLTLAAVGLFAISSAEGAESLPGQHRRTDAEHVAIAVRANVNARYMGTIRSIFGKTLNVANVGNSSVTFEVSDQAAITLNGKKVALSDLRTGYRVTVTADQIDGKLVATVIQAASAEVPRL